MLREIPFQDIEEHKISLDNRINDKIFMSDVAEFKYSIINVIHNSLCEATLFLFDEKDPRRPWLHTNVLKHMTLNSCEYDNMRLCDAN